MPDSLPPFTPVSPKLTTARLVTLTCCVAPLVVAVAVAAFVVPAWVAGALAAVVVGVAAWAAVVIMRQVRHIGYARREHDLVITKGVMFRSTTVVPYGRMQYVEVTSGPVARMLDLAALELHTASASSDATIPGLPRHEAEVLRDELAALGESRLAGL